MLSLEKEQDWSGCVIHPDADKRVLELIIGGEIPPSSSSLLIRHRVILKNAQSLEKGLCINWVSFLSERDLDTGLDFLKGSKRNHTNEFIQYVRTLASNASQVSIPHSSIVAVRMLFARAGMRIKFVDQNGEGVDPPGGFELDVKISAAQKEREDNEGKS